GREKLQGRRLRGARCNDDRIVEGAVILQCFDDLRDGRALLADRYIDAVELLGFVAARIDLPLVQDRVDRQRRLAGLPVADDQLALAAPDWHERVDRL